MPTVTLRAETTTAAPTLNQFGQSNTVAKMTGDVSVDIKALRSSSDLIVKDKTPDYYYLYKFTNQENVIYFRSDKWNYEITYYAQGFDLQY